MVKKKSRLNQACAAAQAQKSKLAHTQKIKALKQSQQNHHQQKLKLKQQPKLFNPQNQSNSQSNSDLKLTSSTIIKSNYPTINDSALDFDQIHPTQQTEIIPFASSSQSNLIPQQHRIKNASQDQPPRSRKSTSMVDRNDKILLIGEGQTRQTSILRFNNTDHQEMSHRKLFICDLFGSITFSSRSIDHCYHQ